MFKERVKHDTRRKSRNETLKQSITMGESASFRKKIKTRQHVKGQVVQIWSGKIKYTVELICLYQDYVYQLI
jgi:hypothetical protein